MSRRDKTYGPQSGEARFARKWFTICVKEKMPEFEDAPPLPLRPEDRHWLMSMKRGPLGYLVACYAASLEAYEYWPFDHPEPAEYARGVMACSTVPEEVRNDPEMLRRFPPKKLDGLDETTLCWRPRRVADQLQAA